MILYNAIILNDEFNFIKGNLVINNGIIQSISDGDISIYNECEDELFDCEGSYVIPGFIDIHIHGAMGADFLDGNFEAYDKICNYLAEKGTTSVLATVMTQSRDNMLNACKALYEFSNKRVLGSNIRGIYLEGPFFSEQNKGAQHPRFLRDANIDYFKELYDISNNLIKIISLAPERNGSMAFINDVMRNTQFSDVSIFLGHTCSDYGTAQKAFDLGANGLTHTFNCMTPIHHREPGIIPAALCRENVYCECVCDGIHVHKAMVEFLYKSIGRDRFLTISDSIRPSGLVDGNYSSGGQAVIVEKGMAYLENNEQKRTIAGSTVCICDCVKNLINWNITSFEDAVYSATAVPAKAAGIYDSCGSITVGKAADLIVVDNNLNQKRVFLGK